MTIKNVSELRNTIQGSVPSPSHVRNEAERQGLKRLAAAERSNQDILTFNDIRLTKNHYREWMLYALAYIQELEGRLATASQSTMWEK